MFCRECGKPVSSDAAFCPSCGAGTGVVSNRVVNNSMPGVHSTINIDRNTLITILLSIGIVISSAFLDMFRFTAEYGYSQVNVIFKVFSGSGYASNGEGIDLEGAQYDFPLLNIMFIVLCLIAVLTIIFACTKKRYGVIICGFSGMIVLFAGFLIYCLSISQVFEMYLAFGSLKQDLELMRLPGIGLVIDFVLFIAITFIGIWSLPARKK